MKKILVFSDNSILIRISGPRDPEDELEGCGEEDEDNGGCGE